MVLCFTFLQASLFIVAAFRLFKDFKVKADNRGYCIFSCDVIYIHEFSKLRTLVTKKACMCKYRDAVVTGEK
jgi:hypothetical protein